MIQRLAFLIQYQLVTDRQTDGQIHNDSACRASILASRGKNEMVHIAVYCKTQPHHVHSA